MCMHVQASRSIYVFEYYGIFMYVYSVFYKWLIVLWMSKYLVYVLCVGRAGERERG